MNPPLDRATRTREAIALLQASASRWAQAHTPTLARAAAAISRGLHTHLPTFCSIVTRLTDPIEWALRRAPVSLWCRLWASPLTLLIVAANLLLFRFVEARGGSSLEDSFYAAGVHFHSVLGGDWWRLLSSGWVHESWSHVYGNCEYLLPFGLLLEPVMGSRAFGLLYCLSTIGSGAGSMLFGLGYAGGASGAISGLNGALLAVPVFASRATRRWAWVWAFYLICNDVGRYDESPLAYAGHLGGLLPGLLVAALFRQQSEVRRSPARWGRFATATLGAAALVMLLACDPRWTLTTKVHRAELQAQSGRMQEAECTWEEIERIADPDRVVEAEMLTCAVNFHFDRGDYTRARALLARIAPTLQDADVYRRLGVLQGWTSPYDDSWADFNLACAYSIDPASPRTLRQLADLALWTDDSTLFHPEKALGCAAAAVELAGGNSPELWHTLAWAQFACGRRAEAIQSLRRALDLHPEDASDYTSALIKMARPCEPWKSIAARDRWYDSDG